MSTPEDRALPEPSPHRNKALRERQPSAAGPQHLAPGEQAPHLASAQAFAALGLSPALARATAEQGWGTPTEVQQLALGPALQGRDVLALAPTGSGKTAAFALPLLQRLDRRLPAWRRTYALVLVPTRDLALQVGETLRALARHLADPVKVAVVFGGVSINPQMMALRGGAEVVVATPGRLLDLVRHNAVALADVQQWVLDEADRLLDEGFAEELGDIQALLPPQRQCLMFSATMAPPVRALAQALLHDPVHVQTAAGPDGEGPAIDQRAIEVDAAQRTPLLRHLIAQGGWPRVLVFVATRYASEHVADKLQRAGVTAAAFHGQLSQGARSAVLEGLRKGSLRVVLATDMAARGLHIADLPVVVNYDLPRSAVDHTHRIGRTARAGARGLAVSFVSAATEAHFRLIEKRQGLRVPREQVSGFEPQAAARADTTATPHAAPVAPDPTGGIKGRRKSKKDKLREAAAREVPELERTHQG